MSYLDPLRLHFAGRFQANVSTVNNDPAHYDNASFKPSYQAMQAANMDPPNGWFNPQGDAAWRFLGCTVTSAWQPAGAVPTSDPVLGYLVADSDRYAPAKLVDLDTEQQLVSEIWGLQVRIAKPDGTTVLRGDFEPAAFADIWNRATGSGSSGGDTVAGAFYQSVLKNLEWGDVADSKFLTALRAAAVDGLLSIKFNVDGFNMDFTSPQFMTGRIAGTIGPATADEPRHLVMGRQFMTAGIPDPNAFFRPRGQLNFCCATIDAASQRLFLDLGNALTTSTPGGPTNDQGNLAIFAGATPLGTVPAQGAEGYVSDAWYPRTAGVVALPLSEAQMQAAAATPLVIHAETHAEASASASAGAGGTSYAFITEWPSGAFVRADRFVYRQSPGEPARVSVIATQFGKPMPGVTIGFVADSSQLQPAVAGPDSPYLRSGPPVATPASALRFRGDAVTGRDGRAELLIETSDPGTPRYVNGGYGIDGQVYGIRPGFVDAKYAGPINQCNFVSVLLWSAFTPSDPVTWDDLQPIFQQYANLYPVMNRFLDMSNYESVVRHKDLLALAFGLDPHNPNAMPVTRDLSPAKRAAILAWLARPARGAGKQTTPIDKLDGDAATPSSKPSSAAAARGGKAAAAARRQLLPAAPGDAQGDAP